jgi:phosphatidylserine/phosphatidylglycerophosphate/cardiolipin synthase-like enzyme
MEFLDPPRTCWRIEAARRVAFLVDYQAYFQALAAALDEAREQVLLVGWSFDPRTRLMPEGDAAQDASDQIGRRLIDLRRTRPGLDIRILIWRSALAVSATQDFFPHRAKNWFKGTGVDFRLDDTVPFGGCHHQKVIVIDDRLAFCSGGDLCGDRWDTPAHLDRDARRRSPRGGFHRARHEVTMMVEGPIAAAIGDLARARWTRAGGAPAAAPTGAGATWPASVTPDIEDTRVGIARTEPRWRGETGCEEISALTLAAIAGARTSLYMENQYFTSPVIAEALAARLAEPDGPEVVLVSTHRSASWFDRLTMDRTRAVFIWRLLSADVFGRLRVFAPFTPGGRTIIVHAKVMVVDDTLVRIGSANLNNRSQGFDTECELALEGRGPAEREAIGALRDGLVGHWLGRNAAQVRGSSERHGGLVAAISELNRHGRLQPIEPLRLGPIGDFVADFHLGDPVSVADSWAPRRRRDRLYGRIRRRRILKALGQSR